MAQAKTTEKTLHDILIEELHDIHSAERQLLRGLTKMARAAANPELKQAFEHHREETNGQIERLDQVFESLDTRSRSRGRKCEAMEGLIAEAQDIIELGLAPEARDAALIGAAQKIEHYEIASYGSLCAWAKAMGHTQALTALEATLEEERKADTLLSRLSAGVTRQAAKLAQSA